MYLTLSQAAKETGKSKSALFKALKDGVMSYVDKTDAGYKIDPAELFRVFPKNDDKEQLRTRKETERTPESDAENAILRARIDALTMQIELLEDRIKEKDAAIEDAKNERQDWKKHAERLLLERPKLTEKRRRFFGLLKG